MSDDTIVHVCTYDNPHTMMRECWQGGVLQAAYAAELYKLRDWPLHNYGYIYHFGANLMRGWKPGQMVGDARAMAGIKVELGVSLYASRLPESGPPGPPQPAQTPAPLAPQE